MSEGFNEKVMHMLGEIKGKQDLILENQKDQSVRIDNNTNRIVKLEKKQSYAAGGAAVLAAALTAFLSKAVDIFKFMN